MTPAPEPAREAPPSDKDLIAQIPAFNFDLPRRPIRIDEDDAEDEPQPFFRSVPEAAAADADIELTTVVRRPKPGELAAAQRQIPTTSLERGQDAAQQYPIPPAAYAMEDPTGTVPTWAFRAATQPAAPAAMVDDLSIDPMSLRRRVKIRSGGATLTVDEARLVQRNWLRRQEIPWPAVQGFQARLDEGPGTGRLIALTTTGPVELVATKRPLADLRYIHALLDAYRARAQLFMPR